MKNLTFTVYRSIYDKVCIVCIFRTSYTADIKRFGMQNYNDVNSYQFRHDQFNPRTVFLNQMLLLDYFHHIIDLDAR